MGRLPVTYDSSCVLNKTSLDQEDCGVQLLQLRNDASLALTLRQVPYAFVVGGQERRTELEAKPAAK